MADFNFDTMTDIEIFRVIVPEGEEKVALAGNYPDLVDLIGVESTLKLYKYFRGCKIDCPKFLYRQEHITKTASQMENKRDRARIAVATGYTANRVEVLVNQWKKNGGVA